MKLTIDKEADALYLDLDETPAVESEEISPGVILDYNSEGKVTGIEPKSAAADVDRSPQRPNALLVQTRSVLAVGKSRGRAAGTFGCLLKSGSSGGAWECRPERESVDKALRTEGEAADRSPLRSTDTEAWRTADSPQANGP